jgi:hypothetical protein
MSGENAQNDFQFSMVLTEYERNVVSELLSDAAAHSLNNSAAIAFKHMLASVQSAMPTAIPVATHEIGAIESTGEHKGEIYGGIFPDGRPGWILEEPKPMTHYDAVELKGRALPTSKEGKYIDTIKNKGALKDIFARHSGSSSSAGFFWLAEHYGNDARYQQFSDGSQGNYSFYRSSRLPVLCVLR